MAEFFLELFSEEIPARMQVQAGIDLQRGCLHALRSLRPEQPRHWVGPRRIAFAATIDLDDSITTKGILEARGPREGAPPAAIDGFLRKYEGNREQLVVENGYYILRSVMAARSAADTIRVELPRFLNDFPWPKSMRWGQSSGFTWVRPLRRITCLLDGDIVPFQVGPITSSNVSEGHRVMAPGHFRVTSIHQWEQDLYTRSVIVDADKRRSMIDSGLREKARELNLNVVQDDTLLSEVAGLVEWPVCLIGRIEPRFMALPPEVRELSMKANQRYFAMRDADGNSAPYFGFVANIDASDGGITIISGNERVLSARLADAQHFYALDRRLPLSERLSQLETVVFHASLGTQRDRAHRIAGLARKLADMIGADGYEATQAEWAGHLCKADLVTGMVAEFPELQGIMGGYYATLSVRGWDGPLVGSAIKTHYQPKGPSDDVPHGVVACAVALADKLDTLREFFRIGEKPTGSGDPFALRRAALGVIRIIVENNLRLSLNNLIMDDELEDHGLFEFMIERLRVKLRTEGRRFDILDAVLAKGMDADFVRLMRKIDAIEGFLRTDNGMNLLVAYRRVANILRIESAKDGPHQRSADPEQLMEVSERQLAALLQQQRPTLRSEIEAENYDAAMRNLAGYRQPIDQFFSDVTVNADDPSLRLNRLYLLNDFVKQFDQIADFSKLEG